METRSQLIVLKLFFKSIDWLQEVAELKFIKTKSLHFSSHEIFSTPSTMGYSSSGQKPSAPPLPFRANPRDNSALTQ